MSLYVVVEIVEIVVSSDTGNAVVDHDWLSPSSTNKGINKNDQTNGI